MSLWVYTIQKWFGLDHNSSCGKVMSWIRNIEQQQNIQLGNHNTHEAAAVKWLVSPEKEW